MKHKLFEYSIIAHPTEKEGKDGKVTEIVVEPEVILAADERSATIIASRKIPDAWITKLDQVEIAVRPF